VENDGAGEFVVCCACMIHRFKYMDTIPSRSRSNYDTSAYPLIESGRTLLEQHNTSSAIVQIPHINTRNATLIVPIPQSAPGYNPSFAGHV